MAKKENKKKETDSTLEWKEMVEIYWGNNLKKKKKEEKRKIDAWSWLSGGMLWMYFGDSHKPVNMKYGTRHRS